MSANGFGGLVGAALGLYIIHEVLKDGRTGRKLGVVHARSKKHAVEILSKMKKLPNHVRVFHGKPVKGSKKKVKHYAQRDKDEIGFNVNVTMPRLF